jgi:hypothetical protein
MSLEVLEAKFADSPEVRSHLRSFFNRWYGAEPPTEEEAFERSVGRLCRELSRTLRLFDAVLVDYDAYERLANLLPLKTEVEYVFDLLVSADPDKKLAGWRWAKKLLGEWPDG